MSITATRGVAGAGICPGREIATRVSPKAGVDVYVMSRTEDPEGRNFAVRLSTPTQESTDIADNVFRDQRTRPENRGSVLPDNEELRRSLRFEVVPTGTVEISISMPEAPREKVPEMFVSWLRDRYMSAVEALAGRIADAIRKEGDRKEPRDNYSLGSMM